MIKEIESNIKFKKFEYTCDEEISKIKEKYPFLMPNYSWFYYIVGRPGVGKSTMMMNIVLYYKRCFDKILLISPSFSTLEENIFKTNLPEDQIFEDLDELVLEVIMERFENEYQGKKVLLILDDVQDRIKGGIEKTIKRLVNNKRHILGKGGNLSLIITSQIYNNLALSIRKSANVIFTGGSKNIKEVNSLQEEYLGDYTKEQLNEIWEYTFDNPHNFLIIKANTSPTQLYKNFNKLVIE